MAGAVMTRLERPTLSAAPKALFDLPPAGPSMTELAFDGCAEQARFELHRAADFGNDADLAGWARKWGESLVRAAIGVRADDGFRFPFKDVPSPRTRPRRKKK